jgi:lipopolysaccharide/colanic/teichoic acid biosynthesis glycosyltransferase
MEAFTTQPTESGVAFDEPLPGGIGARGLLVRAAKRAFDVVASGVLLLALLPVVVVVAVLVRLDSPGPAFIRCVRVGYRGRPLRMLKFRKMVADASGAPLTTAEDPRFTRLGRWLTKYKLDELPQLWHVLNGEMSLVGPRPESADFVRLHADDYLSHILEVRPGIIGLSQIAFAEENRVLDAGDPVAHYLQRILPQKVALDRMYATKLSPWLDVRIIFWACVTVLLRKPVAVDRGLATMHMRRR